MTARIRYFADSRLTPLAVPIATLELDPDNELDHTEASVQEIVKLLVRFGWREPVGALKSRRKVKIVIRGNRTLMAARWLAEAAASEDPELRERAMGHESWWSSDEPPDWLMAPALFFADDDATRTAWRISHNKSAAAPAWDWGILAVNMAEVSDEIDWGELGWSAEELAELFEDEADEEDEAGPGGGDANEEPPIPEVPAEPVTKHGEVIQLGPHVLHCEDCMVVMAAMPDNSVDFIGTDGPYGLSPDGKARTWDEIEELRAEGKSGPKSGFMGAKWDAGVPGLKWARECLRILKPGGHLVSFSATRTYHRHACAVEDAGFEIRDQFGWLQWQGFPKSLDVSKAIDKQKFNRAEVLEVTAWIRGARDAAGLKNADLDDAFGFSGMSGHWTSKTSQPSVPTLEQVPTLLDVLGVDDPPPRIRELLLDLNATKGEPGPNWWKRSVTGQHDGHAFKDWENNCGGGRDDVAKERRDAPATEDAKTWAGWGTALKPAFEPAVVARKPLSEPTVAVNVLKWGTGAINIDAGRFAFGDPAWPGPSGDYETANPSFENPQFLGAKERDGTTSKAHDLGRWPANIYATPKPATSERNEVIGLEAPQGDVRADGGAQHTIGVKKQANHHPTVKPRKLFSQLLALFCPPGGTAFEPFGGSGTTLVAACGLDCKVIACEMDPGYSDIIRARTEWALKPGAGSPQRKPGKRRKAPEDGNKRQARRRVQTLIQSGKLPAPADVTCVDCEDAPGREYDHHLGYGAAHHEDVEALCASCHHKREAGREAAAKAAVTQA